MDAVARLIGGRTEAEFLGDEALSNAVAHKLTVVGEAVARLSAEIKERHASIPWPGIVALRNLLVHEYFGVHWPLVWQTAADQAPALRAQIAEVVRMESPE